MRVRGSMGPEVFLPQWQVLLRPLCQNLNRPGPPAKGLSLEPGHSGTIFRSCQASRQGTPERFHEEDNDK